MRAMLTAHAIRHFGSAQGVALASGLKTRQAVYGWGREVPDLYQFRLHYLTGGALRLSPRLRAVPSCRKPALARRGHVSPR